VSLIGVGGKPADLEVLRLAAEILSRLNLQSRYCITINNVEIFNGVAASLKLEEACARTVAASYRHSRNG
jgi:histidyl-tRNA synthetase